eukprot:Gb_09258 [translate_table: standard]
MASATYASGAFRSRDGLSSRSNPQNDQLQLRIDPLHGDLDEEIAGLHHKVSQLKNVAQEIESEAKFQNGILSQLPEFTVAAKRVLSRAETESTNSYFDDVIWTESYAIVASQE